MIFLYSFSLDAKINLKFLWTSLITTLRRYFRTLGLDKVFHSRNELIDSWVTLGFD